MWIYKRHYNERKSDCLSGKMISTGADGISQSLEQLDQSRTLLLEKGLI